MNTTIQSDLDRVASGLRRPWYAQRLDADFENAFAKEKDATSRKQIVSILCIMVAVTILTLLLDVKAGCFREAFLLKVCINIPLCAVAITCYLLRFPSRVRVLSRIIAVSSLIFTTIAIGLSAPTLMADRYTMSAGMLCFAINLIMPIGLREAALQSLVNLTVYVGVPLTGLLGSPPSIDINLGFAVVVVLATRIVLLRERADKNAFLMRMRDRLQTAEMGDLIDKLTTTSLTDSLTGIANRRGFDLKFDNALRLANTDGREIALFLVDIDQFKLFNDTAGHLAGDGCLKEVASAISSAMDCEDVFVSRYGGEEFVILFTSPVSMFMQECLQRAERIRSSVEDRTITHPGKYSGVVTVSIGVAMKSMLPQSRVPADLIEAADQALYAAKRNGRNRVELYEHDQLDAAA